MLACAIGRCLMDRNLQHDNSFHLSISSGVKQAIRRSESSLGQGQYQGRDQHNSKTIHINMRELFFNADTIGLSCDYNARPILTRIYTAIFGFSITQPELPYILFQNQ